MESVASAIRDTIPISLFNRGLAGKIFEEVKKTGAKVVMKNNKAECVLMSPEEYVAVMDELEDARLLSIAQERLAKLDLAQLASGDEVWSEFGVSKMDLEGIPEVEFE